VRERLGLHHPSSYIKLLADSITGRNWDSALVDSITLWGFALVVVWTILVNIWSYRCRMVNRSDFAGT
jgi:hypothetical protein